MARFKYGNFSLENVTDISINEVDKDTFEIDCRCTDRIRKFKCKKPQRVRVETKGTVNMLQSYNCATVFGDINTLSTGNSMYIEGCVKDYTCPRGTVNVDKFIKVAYGNEARSGFDNCPKARIIHIYGDLNRLIVQGISNMELEVVNFGNCSEVHVGNCANVKGTVFTANAGNTINCTMGKSIGKSPRELKKEGEQTFNTVFGGLFNR